MKNKTVILRAVYLKGMIQFFLKLRIKRKLFTLTVPDCKSFQLHNPLNLTVLLYFFFSFLYPSNRSNQPKSSRGEFRRRRQTICQTGTGCALVFFLSHDSHLPLTHRYTRSRIPHTGLQRFIQQDHTSIYQIRHTPIFDWIVYFMIRLCAAFLLQLTDSVTVLKFLYFNFAFIFANRNNL